MTAQTPASPEDFEISTLDQFDAGFLALSELSDEINKVLARRDRARRRMEQRYALVLLPLLAMVQKLIDEMKAYASAHRRELVRKGTQGKIVRPLGELQFRSDPQVVTEDPDDVILERLFRTGGELKEKFVREVPVKYELARNVMRRPENRPLVDAIEGVTVDTSEVCLIQPAGVAKAFSSGRPLWPFPLELEGRDLQDADLEGIVGFIIEAVNLWQESFSSRSAADSQAE